MSGEVVPFGKYKGQPLEAMAADQQYLEWLMGQSWFRDRYQNIYTLIVNNFTEPSETPEHNALQAMFLNAEECISIARDIGVEEAVIQLARERAKSQPYSYEECVDVHSRNCKHHSDELDRYRGYIAAGKFTEYDDDYVGSCYGTELWYKERISEHGEKLAVEVLKLTAAQVALNEDAVRRESEAQKIVSATARVTHFEHKGWDVVIAVECNQDRRNLYLELKPSLGDDYPAVLRQMKANSRAAGLSESKGSGVLVIRDFCATGATLDQVRMIFETSGFKVAVRK